MTLLDDRPTGYRHEALFYANHDEFMRSTLPFLRAGIAANDPTLVVLSAAKIVALREALGDDALLVEFADMTEVGGNPARIIPAWDDFIQKYWAWSMSSRYR
jgi:MEDS: MEthanogen/methylotroph, DcmR Sensory domain